MLWLINFWSPKKILDIFDYAKVKFRINTEVNQKIISAKLYSNAVTGCNQMVILLVFARGYIRSVLTLRLDTEFCFIEIAAAILEELIQGTAFVEYLGFDCITFHKELLPPHWPPCLLFKRFEVNLNALLTKNLSFTRWK